MQGLNTRGSLPTAEISACGRYRYVLTRPGDLATPMKSSALFCMLNPSTADASADDPTIRRCRGFARAWDCAGVVVVNLYAFRSTAPAKLWAAGDPVGDLNNYWLRSTARELGDVVCAWGANARQDRVDAAVALFREAGARLWCLGITKDGAPRHPLYVRADQPLIEYSPREAHGSHQ